MIRTALSIATLVALAATARADVFVLKNDGRVEGRRLNSDDRLAREYVIRTADGGQITIARSQVKEIIRQRPAEIEYEKIAPTYPDTVAGQLALAEWCAEKFLAAEGKAHLCRVIELEPDHETARRRLDYQKYQGEWLTRDEVLQRKGLLKYKGKALTAQEIELLEKRSLAEQKEKAWFQTMKRLRDDLDTRDREKQEAAKARILAIDDPHAIKAILFYYDRENERRRPDAPGVRVLKTWFVEVLGRLGTQEAIAALVTYSLEERDDEVRLECFEAVSKYKIAATVNRYMAALRDRDNDVVQRAAIGLRYMGDRRAIVPLIESLVTQHVYDLPTAGASGPGSVTTTFDKSGRGGGGLGVNQKPRKIRRHIFNEEVHATLTRMTGQDFGFDQKLWRKWFATQKELPEFDGRRG